MMFWALVKKQLAEIWSKNRQVKNGKKQRSPAAAIVLFSVLFVALAATFFFVCMGLLTALGEFGLESLYFCLASVLAVALGVFGSVFNTYSSLYLARDNESLLAMPIPPIYIIASRLVSVYAMGLLYEAIVMLPAVAVWIIFGSPSALSIVFSLLLIPLLGFLILALTCVLGFLVAIIASRLKNKSMITVIISLVLLGGYYYLCSQMSSIMDSIIENSATVAAAMRSYAAPLYLFGRAAVGEAVPMLLFTLIALGSAALICAIIALSFRRIAVKGDDRKKAVYKAGKAKAGSSFSALCRKEFSRFLSSPTYMLNCGLGLVFMLIADVFLIVKHSDITELLALFADDEPSFGKLLPVAAAAALCLIGSMNDISAPSISLEGKNLWLLQSLPVEPRAVLRAKQSVHVLLSAPMIVICGVIASLVLGFDFLTAVLVCLCSLMFMLLGCAAGLAVNLKKPNLTWVNETVPIKQSGSIMLVLFGGWLLTLLFGGAYFFLSELVDPRLYLALFTVIFGVGVYLCNRWLDRRGAVIFAEL